MKPLCDYEQQVYAGVLGKVIGVYMGRPFEGWWKDALEKRWGRVDRYVHEDCGKPLVVPDDDISGTLTFVRALADSGRYAETPSAWALDELHELRLVCRGTHITGSCDGKAVLETEETVLDCGGAGFLFERGLLGFRDVTVSV